MIKHLLVILLFLGFYTISFSQEFESKGKKKLDKVVKEVEALHKKAHGFFSSEDSIRVAIRLLDEAYAISDAANYTEGIIKSTEELGRGYLALSENAKATRYFYMSLKMAESVNDSSSVSQAYIGLGLVMYGMHKWSDAISYFTQSSVYNHGVEASSLIGYLLGLCYYNQGDYVKSRDFLVNSKESFEEESSAIGILEARLYLNNLESQRSSDSSIMDEYDTLIELFDSAGEKVGVCFALEGKSRYLLKLGKIDEASLCANKSLEIARKVGLVYPLHSILDVVIKTEYDSGRYKSAADFLLELEALKDSLMNEDAATQIAILKAGHDFEKKEASYGAQIDQKNRQRVGLIILLVALGIVTLIIFLSLRGVAKERKRSDLLLTNILPEETAKELKETGTSSAKAHKQVTIVFADIVSFTQIASNLAPQALVKMLHTYFSKFDLIIKSFGLEKIKTIGDAYMFVSGLQNTGKNSGLDAVEASLQMLMAVNDLEKEMHEKYGVSFQFRIGMHTGEVVSGVVGTVKYAFDIWGDAVNVAARVEEKSMPGCVNLTEDTYQLVKDKFNCESRGKIQIKNRGELSMYFATAQKKA